MWNRGRETAAEIKVAIWLILNREIIPHVLIGSNKDL